MLKKLIVLAAAFALAACADKVVEITLPALAAGEALPSEPLPEDVSFSLREAPARVTRTAPRSARDRMCSPT